MVMHLVKSLGLIRKFESSSVVMKQTFTLGSAAKSVLFPFTYN